MEKIELPQESKKPLIVFDLYWTLLKLPSKSIKSRIEKTIRWFLKQDEAEKLKQIKREQLIKEIGMNKEEIKEKCWVELTDSQFESLKANTEKEIAKVQLYPDVLETLKYLKSKWYEIGIISNLWKAYEEPIRRLLDWKIDYEILSYQVWKRKPDYEIFEKMSEVSWYELKDMVMVWDSLKSDVLWSKNAWMFPILLKLSSDKMQLVKCGTKYEEKFEIIQIHRLSDLKERF